MADYTTTFSDLNTLLQSLPANTVSTPYSIIVTGVTDNNVWWSGYESSIGYILNQNPTKYVDLSENDFSNFNDNGTSYRSLASTFENCESLIHGPTVPTQLSSVVQYCTNLTSIRIKFHHESTYEEDYTPGTCAGDNYDEFPFWGCTSLTDIYVETAEDKEAAVDYWGGLITSKLSKDPNTVIKVVPEPEPAPQPRTITTPDVVFVTPDGQQTLTNKTISTNSNTLTNVLTTSNSGGTIMSGDTRLVSGDTVKNFSNTVSTGTFTWTNAKGTFVASYAKQGRIVTMSVDFVRNQDLIAFDYVVSTNAISSDLRPCVPVVCESCVRNAEAGNTAYVPFNYIIYTNGYIDFKVNSSAVIGQGWGNPYGSFTYITYS
jgi:hypothetical protein